MSTFNRPDKFVPVNISSDPTAYLQYTQQRMDLMSTGEAMVRSQYKQLLDLDFTHDTNKNKINNFLKESNDKLTKVVNSDLSNLDNVKSGLNIFAPLTQNPEFQPAMLDAQYTKHYQDQIHLADSYKYQMDKKGNIGEGYGEKNMIELQQNYQKFKNGNPANPSTWGDMYSYHPYYDSTDEVVEKTKDFMKRPDTFETETLQPETGLTRKDKYEGKSAQSLQRYLTNVLSDKAKDQYLLDGRVEARNIDDNKFVDNLKYTTQQNLDKTKKDLLDLQVFGSKTLSKEQIEQKQTSLQGDQKALEAEIFKFDNPKEVEKFKNNKLDILSNTYLNTKIAGLAESMAYMNESHTYGTNNATVSYLNRQQGAQEFLNKLNEERREFDLSNANDIEKNKIEAWKAGFNVDGTPLKSNGFGGIGTGGIHPETITDGDKLKEIQDKYEESLQTALKGVLPGMQNDAYKALGITEVNGQNDIKAMKHVFDLAKWHNSGTSTYTDNLLKADKKSLVGVKLADRNILDKLIAQDATVKEVGAYNTFKQKKIKEAETQIDKMLTASGVSLNDVNEHMSGNDFSDSFYQNNISQDGIQGWFKNHPRETFKTREDLIHRLATDSEFAEAFDDRMKPLGANTGSALIGIINTTYSGTTGNPGTLIQEGDFKNKSYIARHMKEVNDNLQKSLAMQTVLVNNIQSISRPSETQTPGDKVLNSQFNAKVNEIMAANPDLFKDIDPHEISQIDVAEGKYILHRRDAKQNDKTGDWVLSGSYKDPIEVPDATVKLLDTKTASMLRTMGWNGGTYNYSTSVHDIPTEVSIKTKSGQPYTNGEPINASITIKGVTIDIPHDFVNPLQAEEFMRTFKVNIEEPIMQHVLNEKRNEVHEELVREKIPEDKIAIAQKEILTKMKETGIFDKLFQEKTKKALNSGEIFKVVGMEDPNSTHSQNYIQDFIDHL